MGTWALDHNTGLAGLVYRSAVFNGNIFMFCYGDGAQGGGVWIRDGIGPWTRTISGQGRGCYWDGLLWWAGDDANAEIYFSVDGINWSIDYAPAPAGFTHWSALKGYGDYLYAAFSDGADTHFYRRDKFANWVATPDSYAEADHAFDIIGFGSKVYWTAQGAPYASYVWDGSAWAADTTLGSYGGYFTVYNPVERCLGDDALGHENDLLLVAAFKYVYRMLAVGGGWILEFTEPNGLNLGGISVGADGIPWIVADDAWYSYIYGRLGSFWVHHSTIDGILCKGVNLAPDGIMYMGRATSCRFYVYTAEFGVDPFGTSGLYPQALDVDGDGDALYVCVYNASNQPLLIKVPTQPPTLAMGCAILNPASGSAVNVKCANVGGALVASGYYFNNSACRSSVDGGLTFHDVDDNWGAGIAQPVLISDTLIERWAGIWVVAEIVVSLEVGGVDRIEETVDGGATWTQRQADITYSPVAFTRLPEGDDLILADDGANRIDYSPNRGETLADITGAFAGNVAALDCQ